MATLKDIQRRIRTVQKTQQITSAMRMVAAAKLRRAQDAIIAARPYARKMYATLGEIGRRQKDAEHPLLQAHEQAKVAEVVIVTSDRGLCGGFNNNVIKRAEQAITALEADFGRVLVAPVGRRADDYFRRRRPDDISRSWSGHSNVEVSQAVEIAEHLGERFVAGEVDRVVLVYNEFVTAMTQTPQADELLPFGAEEEIAEAGAASVPFEIEPDAAALLQVLVPQALEFTIYRALLENQAGEHAARMAAMESATRNTEELIKSLTLQFNRARQAAITTELVEIVSGAEAL
jgi:F-type H+-transporting ATPase subunit gamma